MGLEYCPRIVDEGLDSTLRHMGAVLIKGPRWCGKTRTAEEHSRSRLLMQNLDSRA